MILNVGKNSSFWALVRYKGVLAQKSLGTTGLSGAEALKQLCFASLDMLTLSVDFSRGSNTTSRNHETAES